MTILKRLFDTNRYCKENEKQGKIPNFFKVSKDIMKIVWASMIESFLVSLVTLFDGIQVAEINDEANAAVTISKQPFFILISLAVSLNVCISAIVARRKGQNDIEGANKTVHLGVFLAFCLSVVLSIVALLNVKNLCLLMQAEEDTLVYAVQYLSILFIGFPFSALTMAFNACQKGVGKTHISMISNVAANIVNVTLNYLLIKGRHGFPELGIQGAAIATVVGYFVGFIISLISIIRQKDFIKFRISRILKWDKETFAPFKKIWPAVIVEQLLMRAGFMLFAIIINRLGTDGTYIHGVVNDINSLLFTLSDGFSVGIAAIVGHKLGEKRVDLAIVYAKVAMILSVTCGIIMCFIMILLRKQLVGLYKPDSDYRFNTACNCLLIAAASCIFQNIQWVNTGILRSAGDSKFTATTSLISVTLIRPLMALLFIYVFFTHKDETGKIVSGLGVYGAWVAQFIDQALRMTFNLLRFKSRKWTKIKV